MDREGAFGANKNKKKIGAELHEVLDDKNILTSGEWEGDAEGRWSTRT